MIALNDMPGLMYQTVVCLTSKIGHLGWGVGNLFLGFVLT